MSTEAKPRARNEKLVKDSQMELAFLDSRYACVEGMQKAYISQQRDALEEKEE